MALSSEGEIARDSPGNLSTRSWSKPGRWMKGEDSTGLLACSDSEKKSAAPVGSLSHFNEITAQ